MKAISIFGVEDTRHPSVDSDAPTALYFSETLIFFFWYSFLLEDE
jgi:hypothetical protein